MRFYEVGAEVVSVHRPRNNKIIKKALDFYKKPIHGEIDTSQLYPYQYNTFTRRPRKRIWFTGENIRPPLANDFDAFLSFDQDPYGNYNFYLPTWLQYLALGNQYFFPHVGLTFDEENLSRNRVLFEDKKHAVCVVMRNKNATRLRAIDELRKHIPVDIFGPASGNYLESKYPVTSSYKYTLCFENDLFPGYVTEKLIEAYAVGTVPLYWGDLGSEKRINRGSFINLKDFESIRDFVGYIVTLTPKQYKKIYEEPFLATKFNAHDHVRRIFDMILRES
jgi:hypothetical protein